MKDIRVMSRNAAKRYSAHTDIAESAIISIYSSADVPCRFFDNKRIKAIGRWCFNDAEDSTGISITQAKQIADFVKRHNSIEALIVQCDAGISRSAGIAAAISKWAFGEDSKYFGNPLYRPNMRCYSYMIRALYNI